MLIKGDRSYLMFAWSFSTGGAAVKGDFGRFLIGNNSMCFEERDRKKRDLFYFMDGFRDNLEGMQVLVIDLVFNALKAKKGHQGFTEIGVICVIYEIDGLFDFHA